MAVVKMSEFDLIVRLDQLDSLLQQLQLFNDVVFKDIPDDLIPGFHKYQSNYDFLANQAKQTHIKSILSTLKNYQKRVGIKKKGLLNALAVQTMSYQELQTNLANSDLDELLDTYAEFYDSRHVTVAGYHSHVPWESHRITLDDLQQLSENQPVSGVIPASKITAFNKELNRLHPAYYLYQETDQKARYIILVNNANQEALDILAEKYEFEQRSAISLNIEADVEAMRNLLNHYLDKRRNIEHRISNIGHYKEILQMHYEFLSNEALLESTKEKFVCSKYTVYLSGWIPTHLVSEFQSSIYQVTNGIAHFDVKEADKDGSDVPIKLKNNPLVEAFEPITMMYSQPRYNEIDPTPVFAPFYALFFGMMLADVGYGLIMGLGAALVLKLVNLKPNTQRFLRLFVILGATTALWGFIYGSFFGSLIPLTPIIDISKDFTMVLVMSLILGIFHLFVGLGVKAYINFKEKSYGAIIYDTVFWYFAIGGSAVLVSQLFTDYLASYNQIAVICMALGMIGIVLTSGRSAKTLPGKFASGLYGLYGLTNYIGDVVSYSRLMALGLAGASISMAFNLMVEMVSASGIFGVIAGILIFIVGHTFNLAINGLSSYVHSARLTYVEFFGKFFIGGGKRFESFRAKPTYINIT